MTPFGLLPNLWVYLSYKLNCDNATVKDKQ